MTPIIKWAGGKTKLLHDLLARMPARFGRYYEPFLGGGAMFFALQPERAVVGDANVDLMTMYRAVANDVDGVIAALAEHRSRHSEAHYYTARDMWNGGGPLGTPERAATFIYLNKTCFNGLWRVNRSGEFNVSIGRYTDPPICEPDKLRAAAVALARATLCCGDYRETVADARAGDFVYFDSPYYGAFTGYTANAFAVEDQRALAVNARDLVSRGCQVMLSNSDTPFIRSLYKGFQIERVKCARAINSNAAKRGAVDEVIIVGGYEASRRAA